MSTNNNIPEGFEDLSKVIGLKQVLKQAGNGKIKMIYLANDADSDFSDSIKAVANKSDIEVIETVCMKELGQVCGIDVDAAVVGVLS